MPNVLEQNKETGDGVWNPGLLVSCKVGANYSSDYESSSTETNASVAFFANRYQ